jgi:divalent metal cation (Fe/Co/Zn/Cd) transporter
MREPTREQKAKESAVLYTSIADFVIVSLRFSVALVTHSLTLFGETIRAMLMLLIEIASLVVLHAVHRARFRTFRFGVGKLEQICNLTFGAGLFAGGIWIVYLVVETLLSGTSAATPRGLALAAVVSAINLLVNALAWLAMASASRKDDSAIFRTQLRARLVKLLSSIVVQVVLTASALARDPLIAAWLDGIGASFVACLMVSIGVQMVTECVPDLFDYPIRDVQKERIRTALRSAGVGPEGLVRIRTRRAGSVSQVEITLAATTYTDLADFSAHLDHVRALLEGQVRDIDFSFAVDVAGDEPHQEALP